MARPDPRKLKQEAQTALDKGKFKKAVELYQALEALEPTDGQWARRAGELYRRLNKPREAIQAFERAATKYMNEGFLVKSIAVCKMILQIDPEHSSVRDRLAVLNAERGMGVAERAPEPAPQGPVTAVPAMGGAEAGRVRVAVPATESIIAWPVIPASEPPEAEPPEAQRQPGSRRAPTSRGLEMDLHAGALDIELSPTRARTPVMDPGALEHEDYDLDDMELAPMGGDSGDQSVYAVDEPDDELDLAALAELSMRAVEGGDARPARTGAVPPPVPPRPTIGAAAARGKPDRETRRHPRPRTVPPDAPLDVVDLGSLVPGAVELADGIMSEGVIEIPLDDIEFEQPPPAPTPHLGETETRALRKTPLLSSLGPDAMQHLISTIELVDLLPGQVLFREGDEGRTLYIIAEGSVQVVSEGPPRTHLSTLNEGDFFGEIAIVTDQARNATIEAHPERGAHLLAIDRNVMGDLVDQEPGVLQAILRFLRDRLVSRLIQTSPLFAPFTGPDSQALAGRFRFLEVAPEARVIEQGKRAPGLFVLLSGKLEALREDGGQVRRVGGLEPGGLCGEVSLLAGQPALFSIQAVSKCFLLQLPAQVFLEVIMTHPQVLEFVSDLADERRARYQAILDGDADYESGGVSFI